MIANQTQKRKTVELFRKYVSSPFWFALEVIRNPQYQSVHLVYLQILTCTLYWFTNEEQNMLYIYMSRKYKDFDGDDFAIYTMVVKVHSILHCMKTTKN